MRSQNYLGLEGDLLDARVLGLHLPFGRRIRIKAGDAISRALRDRTRIQDFVLGRPRPVRSPVNRQRLVSGTNRNTLPLMQ